MTKRIALLITLLIIFNGIALRPTRPIQAQEEGVSLHVTLERKTLRERAPVSAYVVLSNGSPYPVIDSQLSILGPPFVQAMDEACGEPLSKPFPIGPVAAHDTPSPTKVCLNLKEADDVGAFTILFLYTYEREIDGTLRQEMATAEKEVTVSLLGADNVMGIPLAFGSLVVPGLFLLVAMSILRVPWAEKLPADNKLYFSVLLSAAIIGLGAAVNHLWNWPFLNYFDVNGAISLPRFLVLAATGATFGVLAGALYHHDQRLDRRRQGAQEQAQKARQPTKEDSEMIQVLAKILDLNPEYQGRAVQVHLTNGDIYKGAHSARFLDKVFLVPSFQLETGELSNGLRAKLRLTDEDRRKLEGKRLRAVVDTLAKAKDDTVKDALDLNQPFSKSPGQIDQAEEAQNFLVWPAEEVAVELPAAEDMPLLQVA